MSTTSEVRRTAGDAWAGPVPLAVLGGLLIAWSAVFVQFAGATPTTSALLRCAYAVPALAALSWWAHRTRVPGAARRPLGRPLLCAVLAGCCFAADLVLWHTSIEAVGAGLATVLANAQVVIVPLVAWLFLRERPHARQLAAIPVLVVGTVLISGAASAAAYGNDPMLGGITGIATAVAYTGFLLLLRSASAADAAPVIPLTIATFVACGPIAAWGAWTGDIDLAIGWAGHGWMLLLALLCQVLAWLLIGASLSRLPAATVSLVLPVQPIGSLALGATLLGERPSWAQWLGVALTMVGIVVAARAPSTARKEVPA